MLALYRLFNSLYPLSIRLAGLFNPKAEAWVEGRRHWRQQLADWKRGDGPVIWMHCASLGEFEQGRPVLEELNREYPEAQLVLTFFSPSGYEMRRNYPLASGVFYLPPDGVKNANDFLDLLRPDMAIFVKYEFWYDYLSALHQRNIPTVLISGAFRPGQVFFKPWGGLFREMLSFFDRLFVQDESSRQLLASIGINRVEVAGDTRIDRVLALAKEDKPMPLLESFSAGAGVLVAGSSWAPEEQILEEWLKHPSSQVWKCIIAPHEIREEHILALEKRLGEQVIRFTRAKDAAPAPARVLILDTIGMLGHAYRYGHAAFIGGGFGRGIHNILEPMSQGLPVLFGPRHQKFREAEMLIGGGAAWQVSGAGEFIARMRELTKEDFRASASAKGLALLHLHAGATKKIVEKLGLHLKNPQLR
ncbi:MAG: glycosyltransferase N-terminal domain-containing protein [Saprospiraceae bacterium]